MHSCLTRYVNACNSPWSLHGGAGVERVLTFRVLLCSFTSAGFLSNMALTVPMGPLKKRHVCSVYPESCP